MISAGRRRRLLVPLWILACLPCRADDRYLEVVRKFVDTMMERGADRYGAVHSPLLAAMLDLGTLSLPVAALPPEFYVTKSGQLRAAGYGLPDPPVGIRRQDRAPVGNNLEHDILLLRAMYELSALTAEKKYAAYADAYLRFWLTHCQSPETGLMASGEHNSWDFTREKAYANMHEVFRRFPFWDKLYSIDPWRAARIADGMWLSQIGDKKTGDFSRHAGYETYHAATGAAYPRHAGFYIWTYANAYVQTRDPKYIQRAEVLIESRTGRRPEPFSLLVGPGPVKPEQSTDAALRLMLWDAAGLVPEKTAAWRGIVRELDEEALAARPTEITDAARRFKPPAAPSLPVPVTGEGHTISTTLSPIWRMGYGGPGVSGRGLLDLTRYRQTGDRRFLRMTEEVADQFVKEGIPRYKQDLWPGACGQVVSLLVALTREEAVAPAGKPRYLAFAQEVAEMAIELFGSNGLFRADGRARHYEAITGADSLLWALLQLYCVLERPGHPLGHIDVNL